MLCSIDEYFLADGTLAGGFALTNLRLKMQRIFDVVIPIGEISPVLFDRNKRRVEISFNVQRIHDSIKDAENYINIHEATVPRSGDIKLWAMPGVVASSAIVALVVNGELISQELVREIGSFTEHAYQIVGSPIFAPTPGTDKLLLETGDFLLLETGDKILLE